MKLWTRNPSYRTVLINTLVLFHTRLYLPYLGIHPPYYTKAYQAGSANKSSMFEKLDSDKFKLSMLPCHTNES